jgi:hypothetical protein
LKSAFYDKAMLKVGQYGLKILNWFIQKEINLLKEKDKKYFKNKRFSN